ncbi:hypothetical protein AB0P21_37000 [Kribbella sp. NPDC056861]|uniref:hypothetical protein n=1 Tax=Kribbella sp. NPDC056861 TaxID=3154857 RepID=UPI003434C0F7
MADIEITATEQFTNFDQQMAALVSGFDTSMGSAADKSASPAAAGAMEEGRQFMTQERQARDTLAQFMSQTSEGLHGYQTAVGAISQEYNNLIALNNTTMNALLQPGKTPAAVNPIFNWPDVLQRQAGGN